MVRIGPIPAEHGDPVTQWLWAQGSTGVAELPVTTPDADLTGPMVTVLAGFPAGDDLTALIDELAAHGISAAAQAVEPHTWPTPAPRTLEIAGHTISLRVGAAFGHGEHPTTDLALRALHGVVTPHTSVLDVGTGTGVLALAACALGARHVHAVEIDPAAVAVAHDNRDHNRVRLGFDFTISSDPLSVAPLRPHEIPEGFEIIIANMLGAELTPLLEPIMAQLHPTGTLLLTGILKEQAPALINAVTAAAAHYGRLSAPTHTRVMVDGRDDWVLLAWVKRDDLDEVDQRWRNAHWSFSEERGNLPR